MRKRSSQLSTQGVNAIIIIIIVINYNTVIIVMDVDGGGLFFIVSYSELHYSEL